MTYALRITGIIILAAVIAVCLFLLPTKTLLVQFFEWVEGLGMLGAFVLAAAFIPACLFCFPGSPITLAAGFLYGLWATIPVSIGSVLGASAAFLVGRYLARDWVETQLAKEAKFTALDHAVAQQGFKIVFLVRLSPLFPFFVVNYLFGLTKVRFWHHFFASWIGMLPGTILYVYFGTAFRSLADLVSGEAVGGPYRTLLLLFGLAATLVVTLYFAQLAKQALHNSVTADNQTEKNTIDQPTSKEGSSACEANQTMQPANTQSNKTKQPLDTKANETKNSLSTTGQPRKETEG